MAFNKQTFTTRALTAAVFAAIMLGGVLLSPWTFFILFSIIHFGCWIEYQALVERIDPGYKEITPFHRYGVMLAGWCLMLWFSSDFFSIGQLRLHELGWWLGLVLVFLLPIMELLFASNIRLKNIGHSFFGLIYISLSWGLMIDLYNVRTISNNNSAFIVGAEHIPLLIIAAIWINDTMAYIVGSFIGKTPLTSISPKKNLGRNVGWNNIERCRYWFDPLLYYRH